MNRSLKPPEIEGDIPRERCGIIVALTRNFPRNEIENGIIQERIVLARVIAPRRKYRYAEIDPKPETS
jgi:hypothetical protein